MHPVLSHMLAAAAGGALAFVLAAILCAGGRASDGEP